MKKTKTLASTFFNIGQPQQPQEEDSKRKVRTNWIPFFEQDNKFPNNLAKRNKRGSTHNAILQDKLSFTLGGGFEYFDPAGEHIDISSSRFNRFREWEAGVNARDETLFGVSKKIAKDLIQFGGYAYERIRIGDRLNVEHRDVTTVRKARAEDSSGKRMVKSAFISRDWDEIGLSTRTTADQEVRTIDMFDRNNRQRNALVYVMDYQPELFYYPLPDYIGALLAIDIEYRIPKFNLDKLDNGLMPSAIMDIFGEPPDGMTPKEYLDEIVDSFTGEGNNGKIFARLISDPEAKTNIQMLESALQGDFETMLRISIENIISAHRWHPSLSGLVVPGKLGNSDGGETIRAYERVKNTVIKDYQEMILDGFVNKAIMDAGFDVRVQFKNAMPISVATMVNPNRIIEINEGRKLFGLEGKDIYDDRLIEQGETREE